MRLIDADKLIEAGDTIKISCEKNESPNMAIGRQGAMFKKLVQDAPTVDAVPVVHGRWERCGGDLHSSGYPVYCSVCNKVHFVHYKYSIGGLDCKELFEKPKYCPSCGAVMDIEE